MVKKQYITHTQAQRNATIRDMSFIVRRNKINMCIGGSLFIIGGVTLPLPTGSIFVMGLGVGLFMSSIPYNKFFGSMWKDLKFNVWSRLVKWGIL